MFKNCKLNIKVIAESLTTTVWMKVSKEKKRKRSVQMRSENKNRIIHYF